MNTLVVASRSLEDGGERAISSKSRRDTDDDRGGVSMLVVRSCRKEVTSASETAPRVFVFGFGFEVLSLVVLEMHAKSGKRFWWDVVRVRGFVLSVPFVVRSARFGDGFVLVRLVEVSDDWVARACLRVDSIVDRSVEMVFVEELVSEGRVGSNLPASKELFRRDVGLGSGLDTLGLIVRDE